MERARSTWIWLGLLCAYAFIHSAGYALTNPVFESPDEPGHLALVNRFASGKGPPNQYNPSEMMAEGHQNPLYYGLVGVALRVAGGPLTVVAIPNGHPDNAPQFLHDRSPFPTSRDRALFFAIRLLGSVFVAILVLQVGLASRAFLPSGYSWLLAPMLAASLPQLAFIGGSISNDVMVAMLAGCALCAAQRCSTDPASRRAWIKLGLWTGLAFLAKKNALCLVPAALIFLAVHAFLTPATRRQTIRAALYGGFVAAIVMAPVFLRNQIVYHDFLANRMEVETLEALVYPQSLNSRHFRVLFPDIVPRSFVAHFGWMIVEVTPKYVWIVVRAILAGALLSALAFTDRRRLPLLVYAWAAFLLNLVGLVYYNLFFPQAQGRLLFPSLASIALLCSTGAWSFGRLITWPRKQWLLVPIGIALAWFDWYAMLINQAFYAVRR